MIPPIKCLLVDDDLDDHEIFSMALDELTVSVEVTNVFNAHQALTLLETEQKFDFIFLDLNMPRVDGKQCLVQIKKMPAASKIPVVIYSTSSEVRDLVEVQNLGAEAYIVKSSSIKDLVAALTDFFLAKH